MKDIIKALYEVDPVLVNLMKKTEHSDNSYNPYHLEGSVWCHTMLVCNTAEIHYKSTQFTKEIPLTMKLACLLHDIGKCYTKKIIEKEGKTKTMFIGHSGFSFFKAINILEKMKSMFNLTKKDIDTILISIALHMDVVSTLVKDNDFIPSAVISKFRSSELFSHLAYLNEFDHKGRFCTGKKFTEKENFAYMCRALRIAQDTVVEKIEKQNKLVIMVGLPCSGKSTIVSERYKDYAVISRDDIVLELGGSNYDEAFKTVDQKEVDKIFDKRYHEAIEENKNIVIDKTNMSKKGRLKLINKVPDTYETICNVVCTGIETCLERNNRVNKTIPSVAFSIMQKSFSMPLFDEFDNIELLY